MSSKTEKTSFFDHLEILPSVLGLIPREFALKHKIVPVSLYQNVLSVAMSNPSDIQTLDDMALSLGHKIQPLICPEAELEDALAEFYNAEKKTRTSGKGRKDEDSHAPVIQLVNEILAAAVRERASDIHLEPYGDRMVLRYRIDGVLHEVPPPEVSLHPAICSRIKIMSELDISENRVPQDGRFQTDLGGSEIDVRVTTTPTVFGEAIVMRLLDQSGMKLGMDQIGLTEKERETFQALIHAPFGMVLLTGPTGSGKTTTLYSALQSVKSSKKKIITIEDPVEYKMPGICQIQVRTKVGVTFSSGLRSILRQDPDIILVGEIRDLETAKIAVQSALTGHLVFSTLHTNDAAGAVGRLMDMGVEPFLLSSALVGIAAQRLVRKICEHCREEITGSEGKEFHGKGCRRCLDTGYRGRIPITEILTVTEGVKRLMLKAASGEEIRKVAVAEGMKTLYESGLEKIKSGVTTREEVLRVCQDVS